MSKPKVALYWCSSCGGCEESVVDLAEDILFVAGAVDIIFWPVALDTKYKDLEALADGEITVSLINGAIRSSEQEQLAGLLRKKSQLIVAHGSCAHLGGVVGLANFFNKEELLTRAFKEVPSVNNPGGVLPELTHTEDHHELKLPQFYNSVKSLDQVIDVDYYIPGCPPPPELIKNALVAILDNKLPPKGTVLAEKKALCDSCSRRDSKPEKIAIDKFKRLYETEWDAQKCFLEEGIVCLGLATRGGCGERCIKGNMPCRGCFGPLEKGMDQGAKALTALAALIATNNEEELKKIIDTIPDLGGLLYRYSLPASLLKGKRSGGKNE